MTSSPLISAQQRLAESRQAIVRHMNHDLADVNGPAHSLGGSSVPHIGISGSTWALIKQIVRAWWQDHPAHLAADFAKPMIQTVAEKNPVKLLAVAAAIGAAAVVVRPWRLFSLTGVLLAGLKSTDITGVVRSLLSTGNKQDNYR